MRGGWERFQDLVFELVSSGVFRSSPGENICTGTPLIRQQNVKKEHACWFGVLLIFLNTNFSLNRAFE